MNERNLNTKKNNDIRYSNEKINKVVTLQKKIYISKEQKKKLKNKKEIKIRNNRAIVNKKVSKNNITESDAIFVGRKKNNPVIINPIQKKYIPLKLDFGEEKEGKSKKNETNYIVSKYIKETKSKNKDLRYLSNKLINKIDDKESDIANAGIKTAFMLKHGYSTTKGHYNNVKKVYYIAKDFNQNQKIKKVKLDIKTESIIKNKKLYIYRNYSLKNLVIDNIDRKASRIRHDKSKTYDTSVDASKFVLEKGYDTYKASQSIKYYTRKISKLEKNRIAAKGSKTLRQEKIKKGSIKTLENTTKKNASKTTYSKALYNKEKTLKSAHIAREQARMVATRMNVITQQAKIGIAVKGFVAKNAIPVAIALGIALLFVVISTSFTQTMASYYGILAEEEVIQEYKDRVEYLDLELMNQIEGMKDNSSYDEVIVDIYGDDGIIQTSFKEILVLNTVIFEQDLTFSEEEQENIYKFHNLMNEVSTRTESYYCDGCESDVWTDKDGIEHEDVYCNGHIRLIITVNCLSFEDISYHLDFTDDELEWARELMAFDLEEMYPNRGFETTGGLSGLAGLSAEEIARLLADMPKTGVTRTEIINNAVSLVGKVPYFWGGKSSAGWNNRWNTPVKVTAQGTSDYGKILPFGMDCSGFTDWVYKTSGIGNILNGGTAHQWNNSIGINKSDARAGDLVFKNPPNSNGINHVGIYLGKDSNGKDQFVHCEYGSGVTINSWSGFKYYRRVMVKLDN